MMKPFERARIPVVLMIFLLLCSVAGRASEPVTIKVLTLDNRPPNCLFLKELAAVAGIDIVVQYGPSSATDADCVSVNAAVAGSLVGSRSADPWTLEPPDVRADALLHFAVPRVEPTVSEQGVAEEYRRVRAALESAETQRMVLAWVQGQNVHMLEDSHVDATASYAHRISGWLDFLSRADYDPDRLLVTFDDNRPGPLSDGLKLMFGEFSHYVYDGTDEGMMLLLARALWHALPARDRNRRLPVSCGVVFTDPVTLVGIMPFESGMSLENLLIMSRWLGVRLTPRIDLIEQWRPVLWIHSSDGGESITQRIADISTSLRDRRVIVADIARPNGGDPALIDAWSAGATPQGLTGYLAWNTSSNTLGSALALWAAIDFAYEHSADPEGVRAATETFLWARFLDDYLYQRVLRPEVTDLVRAGVFQTSDPYNLSPEDVGAIAGTIATRLSEMWHELGEPLALPLRYVEPTGHTGFVVELPWNRLFEIALYPSDNRGILPTINPLNASGNE